METNQVNLSSGQRMDLQELVTALVSRYQTAHIICFGCRMDHKTTLSCFADAFTDNDVHYFLLMITKKATRIEHKVQDFVNGWPGNIKISIIAHGIEAVKNAIAQGNRFFGIVCRNGTSLYSIDGFPLAAGYPNLNPVTSLLKTEKSYFHRYCMALGFLEAAEECFEKEYYNNAVFMLHQAFEQVCMAMIKVFTYYRADMHNISRLLDLCLCFSNKPGVLFPRKTTEDKRLFQLLIKSYADARYNDDYKLSCRDADTLCKMVRALVELAEELCLERLSELRAAVEPLTE